ncbi:hypothetical protein D3C72_2115670 [compost metagenome]
MYRPSPEASARSGRLSAWAMAWRMRTSCNAGAVDCTCMTSQPGVCCTWTGMPWPRRVAMVVGSMPSTTSRSPDNNPLLRVLASGTVMKRNTGMTAVLLPA